ncbi:hypothetical protein GF420_05480 [candidate division GN15 bacterium]|nr:hypothetical protein [candidate division GN15 bacterium]
MPLFSPAGGPFYLTLGEALDDSLLEISEVSESGSVPELQVENKADLPVLLLDGEELVGAKQNRVLNTTILLKKQSTTTIPVSCTEQGRWSYTSPKFADSGHVMTPRSRLTKARSVHQSLSSLRSYRSDQGAVWDEVSDLQARADLHSPTGAMRDVYESRREKLEKYCEAFPIAPDHNGLLVMIDGIAAGLDIVSRPEAFLRIGPKLIKSYAMEALLTRGAAKKKGTGERGLRFLERVVSAEGRSYRSVGHGQDHRFSSPHVVGSALTYRKTVIHAAFFPTDGTASNPEMRGPSRRRRYRY